MTIAIINGKRYNTETATKVAQYWNGYASNDFHYIDELLFITKNGSWFMDASGGALTRYAESHGNMRCGSDKIIPLSSSKARAWLEEHDETEALEKYFSDSIEDA